MVSRLRSLWQQIQQHRLLTTVIIVVLIAWIAFAMALWWFGWDWTGFTGGASQITTTSTSHGTTTATVKPPGKTLWDLLQLLIVPLVLALGAFWLNQIQKDRDQKAAEQRAQTEQKAAEKRAQTEHEIAEDNQREAALQGYIDKMSELLLHENLRESDPEEEVRKIARVRTLTVLPRLDSGRKRSVLEFLYESGLIEKDKNIIDLHGANLREAKLGFAILSDADLGGADLSDADLLKANLAGANLREANLAGAYLYKTDLNKADLTSANLCGARLYNAILRETILCDADLSFDYFPEDDDNPLIQTNLFGADLSGANIRGANLSMANLKHTKLIGADFSKVNLSHADLIRADLERADLTDADLTDANLKGANITPEQLKTAKSLKGATMPDGSKHT